VTRTELLSESFYFRLPPTPPPPAFFSDLVLTMLTGSSFGASTVMCLFRSCRSSSVDKFVLLKWMFLMFCSAENVEIEIVSVTVRKNWLN
jgi:hypothetical protein